MHTLRDKKNECIRRKLEVTRVEDKIREKDWDGLGILMLDNICTN